MKKQSYVLLVLSLCVGGMYGMQRGAGSSEERGALDYLKEVVEGGRSINEEHALVKFQDPSTGKEDARRLTNYWRKDEHGQWQFKNRDMRTGFSNAVELEKRGEEGITSKKGSPSPSSHYSWFKRFNQRLQAGTLTKQDFFITTGFTLAFGTGTGMGLVKLYQHYNK